MGQSSQIFSGKLFRPGIHVRYRNLTLLPTTEFTIIQKEQDFSSFHAQTRIVHLLGTSRPPNFCVAVWASICVGSHKKHTLLQSARNVAATVRQWWTRGKLGCCNLPPSVAEAYDSRLEATWNARLFSNSFRAGTCALITTWITTSIGANLSSLGPDIDDPYCFSSRYYSVLSGKCFDNALRYWYFSFHFFSSYVIRLLCCNSLLQLIHLVVIDPDTRRKRMTLAFYAHLVRITNSSRACCVMDLG